MLSDDLAVASLMGVELQAGRSSDQRLQQRLAFDERQAPAYVPAIEVQKIESVIDEADAALAVARGLRLRKARQAIVANPAQLAVEEGCLRPDLCQSSGDARIFVGPVEPCPG
jgi:hypothetical protein